jgi:protein tyrosine/serine phosphatase
MISNRHLLWEGCYNVRDLGGLPTDHGQETKWQSIIRADHLARLTPTGQQALLDYGVQTVIDLRSPKEVEKEPSLFVEPSGKNGWPRYLNLPLEYYYPHVSAKISQVKNRAEVYCIILDHYPDAVANIMRTVTQAPPGGIVLHCHSGKDRTGTVVALLLGLVGVDPEIIVADYAESQKRLWPLYEKIVTEAGSEENVGFWERPTATAEMMWMTLAHVENKYGGILPYLSTTGLSRSEIVRLHQRLLP